VLASGKAAYSVPMKLSAVHAQIDGQFTLSTIMGVAVNDLMLAVPSTWSASTGCTLFMATAVSSTTVTHASPGSGWNASTAIFPSGGYDTSSVVINLGPSPVRRRYSVNATSWSLQVQDMLTSSGVGTAQEMFPQVVLLKALYGMATAKNGPVTTYSAKPPVTNDDWRYVQSVRVVVVARSAQYEKDVVTTSSQLMWDLGPLALTSVTNAGTVSTCNTTNHCVALDVSASGSGTDWQHYRYKIFDTVVPLRNVVWNP
jgi:type IV pilus assembly protein PilW